MALLPFVPETPIEQRILDARSGALSGDALMREIAAANLYIPSQDEVQSDGSRFQPVLMDQDGAPLVALFTALSRAPITMAPYMLQTLGAHFFRRLPQGYGVIINPGYDAQLLLPPDGAAMLKDDLKNTP